MTCWSLTKYAISTDVWLLRSISINSAITGSNSTNMWWSHNQSINKSMNTTDQIKKTNIYLCLRRNTVLTKWIYYEMHAGNIYTSIISTILLQVHIELLHSCLHKHACMCKQTHISVYCLFVFISLFFFSSNFIDKLAREERNNCHIR